ncbi:hypothetical protein Asp14428_23260 [Actinoplanes sp. NBRC 14428]|nr:hypothetical protein Asp14428_23260 [Actinoplanes sp. NBRC 14428]
MPVSLWITLDSSRIWRRHGPSAELAAVLGVLGLLVMQLRGEYRPGFRAGRHMLAYSEARGSEVLTATLRHRYAMQVLPWTAPLDRIIEQLRSSYEGLVRGGDLQMASTTSFAVLPATLECGRSVESLAAEIEAAAAFAGRTGNGFSQPVIAAYRQLARALQGRTAAPGSLEEDGFAEAEHLSRVSSHRPGLAHYHLCRSLAAALFGDWGALERHTRIQSEALARQPVPGYPLALVHVLRALSCAGQLRRDPGPEAARALGDELGRARDWLAARAGDAPENFRHLLHLVEAERAWAGGDPLTALAAGDAALAAVEAVQRPWHRAFILERTAASHEAYGLHRSARQLLAEARRAYLDWGADGKVRQLDESFPELRTAAPRGAPAGGRGGSIRADVVDTLAILRASQALSSATGLGQLQAAMTEQLTALTGAADVVLALRDGDDWFVPAGPRTGDSAVPVEEAGRRGLVPLTAFRYARRTGEPLLVDDATRDDRFARDPYLAGAERCSLLVMPIFHHDVPQAMLVLSNLYAGGVFTTDRLDAVTLIAGQLAVSLNNALLYASLEERVAERTRALAAANDQLERLSVTDALTGLPNRRAFQRVAAEAWGRLVHTGSPFAVAMIDIDFFKPYNDRNGHQAGDGCLRRVAGALGASVRDASDLACRYGGEEFVLVLADSDEAQAAAVAERARAGVEALRIPHPDNPAGVVTVSVGLAVASDAADGTADALLARADAALYAAKEQGRNRVGRALSVYR